MMSLHKITLRLLALAMALLLAGCIEFDAQEVHLHYDEAEDRIDVMFVYHGLFAESGDIQGSTKQLDEALLEGDFAFWNNWPLKVEATDDRSKTLLKRYVQIENGGLFTTPEGTLGGYQFFRIRKAKSLIRTLNMALNVLVQTEILAGKKWADGHKFDDETRELVREFQRSGSQWISFDGGALKLTIPCSLKDHRWLLERGLNELLKGIQNSIRQRVQTQRVLAAKADDSMTGGYNDYTPNPQSQEFSLQQLNNWLAIDPFVRWFLDNPVSVIREAERTVLVLGIAGEPRQKFVKKPSGRYEDDLLRHLREGKKHRIEDGLPAQELERRFEEFRKREPVLPKAYAEMIEGKKN